MPTALLVYASLTGNTEQCMEVVEEALVELGVEVTVEESAMADPEAFEDADICIVGTYTWGPNGDLPDEIIDFYEEMADLHLPNKIFGVFGSGDTFYDDLYCKSVTDFDILFEKIGATRGAEKVFIDLDPEEEDIVHLQAFAKDLVESYKNQA